MNFSLFVLQIISAKCQGNLTKKIMQIRDSYDSSGSPKNALLKFGAD